METTINKIAIRSLKNQIKQEVEIQKYLKKAIKNATFSTKEGRTVWEPMHPSTAQSKAYIQGLLLRIMYAAYGLMKGKKFSEIENHYPEENHPLNRYMNAINNCIEVHSKVEAEVAV